MEMQGNTTDSVEKLQSAVNSKERTMLDITNEDGVVIQQIEYMNGVPDGRGITYDVNTRQKVQDMQFKEGKLHGEMIVYDQVGNITAKLNYDNGVLSGPCEFYMDGKLILSGQYANGQYDGKLTYYDTFQNIVKEENYENGLKNGKSVSYAPNHQVLKSETYLNGKLNGVSVSFYPGLDNAMHEYADYQDGKINGIAKIFYDDGNLQEIRVYSMGNIVGEIKRYDRNGNLIS